MKANRIGLTFIIVGVVIFLFVQNIRFDDFISVADVTTNNEASN